jgi:GNAT superfamily N-acetyltransferase
MPPDTLTPAGVVEQFERQFGMHSTLPGVMPMPGVLPNSDAIELTTIGVYAAHQGKGYASLALQMLTDLCDENGVTIKLTARPLLDSLLPRCKASKSICELVSWYRRHGFDVSDPNNDMVEMIRPPL